MGLSVMVIAGAERRVVPVEIVVKQATSVAVKNPPLVATSRADACRTEGRSKRPMSLR